MKQGEIWSNGTIQRKEYKKQKIPKGSIPKRTRNGELDITKYKKTLYLRAA